jgi:hypothetical protein
LSGGPSLGSFGLGGFSKGGLRNARKAEHGGKRDAGDG